MTHTHTHTPSLGVALSVANHVCLSHPLLLGPAGSSLCSVQAPEAWPESGHSRAQVTSNSPEATYTQCSPHLFFPSFTSCNSWTHFESFFACIIIISTYLSSPASVSGGKQQGPPIVVVTSTRVSETKAVWEASSKPSFLDVKPGDVISVM